MQHLTILVSSQGFKWIILTFVHFDICIGLIAVPQDNRQIYVHDLNGHKLTRLPRDSTKSHHRMVSAVCWAPDAEPVENWRSKANLFSAGFDRMAFGWSVKPAANKEEIIKLKEKTKDGTF